MKRNFNILWLSCMFKPQFSLIKRVGHIEMTRKICLVRKYSESCWFINRNVSLRNQLFEQLFFKIKAKMFFFL